MSFSQQVCLINFVPRYIYDREAAALGQDVRCGPHTGYSLGARMLQPMLGIRQLRDVFRRVAQRH
jgi:hypothetical protein